METEINTGITVILMVKYKNCIAFRPMQYSMNVDKIQFLTLESEEDFILPQDVKSEEDFRKLTKYKIVMRSSDIDLTFNTILNATAKNNAKTLNEQDTLEYAFHNKILKPLFSAMLEV